MNIPRYLSIAIIILVWKGWKGIIKYCDIPLIPQHFDMILFIGHIAQPYMQHILLQYNNSTCQKTIRLWGGGKVLTHTFDTLTRIHAVADACRHDKHSRHSGNTHAGNVVKTEWLRTCLHTLLQVELGPERSSLAGVGLAFQVKEVVTCPSNRPINQPAQPH